MIVGYDRQEIELIIEALKSTAKASEEVSKHYKDALKEHPEQKQWLKVIGKAEGRRELAGTIIEKLSKLIQD